MRLMTLMSKCIISVLNKVRTNNSTSIPKCLCFTLQCQIIYPREQLFTIFELETMEGAECEVSEHSLILRKIAV